MKGPADFQDALTPEDLATLDELTRDMEEWFGAKHEEYMVNTNEDPKIPERVWRELVSRAAKAGWDASMRGAMVSIKKPRR